MLRVLAVVTCALLLTACGSDGADGGKVDIASGPLSGKVGGSSWTLAGARTNASLSDDEQFWVDMYGAGTVTCDGSGQGNSLIVSVPRKVGSYRLNLDLNGTFVVGEGTPDNFISTEGAIRVDEVTASSLRGGLSMTYDASNSVSGDFEATVCN